MADTLGVKITADVVDLQAKMAVARAEVNGFAREMNSAARQVASSGMTTELKTQLTAAAEGLVGAQSKARGLSAALEEAGHTAGGMHGSISQATREFRALFDELSSGRTRMTPGTLAIIGQRVFGLGPAALVAAGAVAGLGLALYEVAKHAHEAAAAAETARAAFAWDGLDETREQINEMTAAVAKIPGVTYEAAGKTVAAFAEIKNAPPQVLAALVAIMPDLIAKFGDGEKAVKAFADEWNKAVEKGESPAKVFDDFVSGAHRVDQALDQSAITQLSFWDKLKTAIGAGAAAEAGAADQAQNLSNQIAGIDPAKVAQVAQAIKDAQEALAHPVAPDTNSTKAFEAWRRDLSDREAAEHVSYANREAFDRQFWQDKLSIAKAGSDAQRAVSRELYDEDIADQRKAVEEAKQAATKMVEAQKQAAQQERQMAISRAETELQIGKIRIQSERDTLDAQVAAGKVSAAQKEQTLKDLENKEYQLDRQRLEDEVATLDTGTAAWQQALDKIAVLNAQHAANLAKIDLQVANDNKKAASEAEKVWDGATKLISRDFDQMLTGILRGTQTWQQAVQRALGNMVVSAIENIAKVGIEWAMGEAKKLALTLLTNETIVASDTAQAAASAAAANAPNIGPSVLKHAASAAAATYDEVNQIPYVGWILAPPAAAAAFAAVAAFSAEGGMWSVPADGTLIAAHKQESVLPAAIAGPMRDFFTAGGQSSGGDSYHITIQAIDTQTGAQFLKNNMKAIVAGLANQKRLGNSSLSPQPA